MFNFASKVINAIGDLVSDVDPPKPAQPQPLQPSPQRRSSADARFFQTKYSPRFPTPSQSHSHSQDDHLPRLGSSSGGSGLGIGGGGGGGQIRPSSTPVYRYPTTTAHATPSYRPERYEESKFKAPDIDYNEDGYNVGRNYNGSERQSSYITELQKEYGMYREHDVDDVNDYEEEDRYSSGYENEGNRRRRSLSSERETSQLKSTSEEYNENVIYSDPTDRNHYARESHHSKNEPSTSVYDTHQLFSSDQYGSSDSQNTNDFAQFTSMPSTSSWISEEIDDYNKSRRRRKSNPESDKQFRIDSEEKISPSPPSQDEDARNSSRSESESSDEISFGEALATGLIPPNITPEIAARMNIELINHPKAVIESFYGHSPGEVYTIPEEEDEICSPTGADGVTSLRKQRMASARVESSSTDQKELQNQRGRISSTNQQSDLRLKQKYSGQSLDSKSELERQLISNDMKENRPMVSEFTAQDAHKPFNPLQKYLPEEHKPATKQPFRYVQSTTQPDNAQYNYGPEKPTQQTMPPLQQKPYKNDSRPQPYQPEIRPQMYQPEVRPQLYQPDGRPQVYQYDRTPQTYPSEIRPPGHSSDRSQIPFQDRSQPYSGDRAPQSYQPDNQTQYPAQVGQTDRPQNYPQENIQPYQPDNRPQQQQQQQPYQPDNTGQAFQPISQNSRAQGYQPDNRSQNYQSVPPQGYQQPSQNFQKDGRTQGYQPPPHQSSQQQQQHPQQQQQQQQQPPSQTDRQQNYPISDRPTQSYPPVENQPQGYQQGYQPQNYPPDNRSPQGYQPLGQPYQQGHPQDSRAPGYQQSSQGHPSTYQPPPQNQPPGYQQGAIQGHPPDGRPVVYPQGQAHPVDNRSQGYQQPPQGYPPDNRLYPDRSQNYPVDNRPVQGFQQDNRSQPYPADPRAQPYPQDKRQKPQETRRLPQPQQYDDQSQRPPNQNYPQGAPPYRESDNHYTQFQRHPNDLQDDRRLPPAQGSSQQDYQDQYHQQQDPRDSPQDRQFSDQGQSNRRRLPLRKYNSEERYGDFQQDYDRRGSQSHESPGRMQHGEEYDEQNRPVRRFPERLKHRSSSLEHERDDQHYSRSRSSSFERSHYADEVEYEQNSSRDQRQASLEHKKMLPRVAQEHTSSRQSTASKPVQSRGQSRSTSGNSDKTRIHKQGSWQENSPQDTSRSRLQQDSRKEENFCLQHKKFTGSPSSVAKPTRRVLPKEPSRPAQRKPIKRSQSQDKSTTTAKSEDTSHQRTGILSNAARKTERSGQLKITFSDPISNLLNPKKNTASSVAGHSRTETTSKNTSTKSDKPVITSNILPQSKNYIYPLPVVKTANQPEPPSRSPIPPTPSPLYRNQPQFVEQPFRDSRLALSPNARSLPIPIAQRTCSLDRYSSSETNLNTSPYYHDQFSRPGSAPGLMYEPVHQSGSNQPNPLSLYELHALKKEEKFWSDIYSALPADMKHLITNRNIGPMSRKLSNSNASFSSVVSSAATVIGGSHPAERVSLENRMMQRSMMAKGQAKGPNQGRDNFQSSLGERIGNRLRMLHEMKEQAAAGFNNKRKMADSLSRRSASDGEYSFSSTTNFPLCWNLTRRPHSDSAIDLIDRLEVQNAPTRVSGSAYNSSEYLTKVVDKSQSYLASPCTNVPPSPAPAPAQPVRMLRDTALRGDHIESLQVNNYLPLGDNRSGFFSCLQNIESLTRQYEEEDRMRTELVDYDDEIYSEPGIPDSEYGRYHRGLGHPRRRDQPF